MTDLTTRNPLAIMFSGGSDSLALLSMAYKGQLKGITSPTEIHLLYMLNGMSRFPSFPRERCRIAKELLESQIAEPNKKPAVHYVELDTAR
jgi:3'-phosphoadenosine 5'-phosphosulfate sulfotransferase (PAPS reductase)/FAD synthetase